MSLSAAVLPVLYVNPRQHNRFKRSAPKSDFRELELRIHGLNAENLLWVRADKIQSVVKWASAILTLLRNLFIAGYVYLHFGTGMNWISNSVCLFIFSGTLTEECPNFRVFPGTSRRFIDWLIDWFIHLSLCYGPKLELRLIFGYTATWMKWGEKWSNLGTLVAGILWSTKSRHHCIQKTLSDKVSWCHNASY